MKKRPLPAVYAAWHKNEKIRKDSASGGAFSAIAEYVLEGGGVVFGAAFDAHEHLRQVACFRKEELWRLRGSKYVQSDLGNTFREVREALKTRQVFFTGTPCQVDGLYRYLGNRPENLITADLVCYGVPSPGVWENMARMIERRKGKEIQAVRFRNKVTTWADSHFTVVFSDGSVDTAPVFKTDFGRAYEKALFLRPSCYSCPYSSMSRPGDFTLGDLWGLRPEEMTEQQEKGISLLMVNTPHGSHVFDQMDLICKPFPAERAIAGNQALASPNLWPEERSAFFAAYALQPFDQVWKKFLKQPSLPFRAAAKLRAKLKR